jgi:nucleoside-diphosphate-sugar epimerase
MGGHGSMNERAMAEQLKPVLVTGGRGFLGRAVGNLLRREGYDFVSLDQANVPQALPSTGSGQASPANTGHSAELTCDITDDQALQSLFEKRPVQAIVHRAAILPTAAQLEPVRATHVNVHGSLNLLEVARRFGVRRFIFGSSVSIYGSCRREQAISEQDRAAPEDLYGAAKLYVEQLGQAYRERHGLDFVSLRIVRVVGPGANSKTSAWRSEIFEKLNAKEPTEISIPYAGSERVLLAHVEDVARMIAALLRPKQFEHFVYNSPCESLPVDELKREIERLNPNVRVRSGDSLVTGNPFRLDTARFESEFGFQQKSIFEHFRNARKGPSP